MAFDVPKKIDLLKYLNRNDFSLRQSSNLLWLSTSCLKYRYARDTDTTTTSFSDFFQLDKLIGEGSFSNIYRGTSLFNEKVAIKVLKEGFNMLGYREAAFLRVLGAYSSQSKYFVSTRASFCDSQNKLCLVMELYTTTLLSYIHKPTTMTTPEQISHALKPIAVRKGLSNVAHNVHDSKFKSYRAIDQCRMFLSKLQFVSSHLVSALCVLKSEGVIHGDIKPENILINYPSHACDSLRYSHESNPSQRTLSDMPYNCQIALCDFGNAIHISECSKYYDSFDFQSLPYRAPEVILGVPFGHAVDMWSVGIVLLELCTSTLLFTPTSVPSLFQDICKKLSPPPYRRYTGGKNTRLFSNWDIVHQIGGKSEPCDTSKTSLGVDLFNSVYCKVDFSTHMKQVSHIIYESQPALILSKASPSLVHFLSSLLHPDPDLRISPLDAMQHPFLRPACHTPSVCFTTNQQLTTLRSHVTSNRVRMSIQTLRKSCAQNTITAKLERNQAIIFGTVDIKSKEMSSVGSSISWMQASGSSSPASHGPSQLNHLLKAEKFSDTSKQFSFTSQQKITDMISESKLASCDSDSEGGGDTSELGENLKSMERKVVLPEVIMHDIRSGVSERREDRFVIKSRRRMEVAQDERDELKDYYYKIPKYDSI